MKRGGEINKKDPNMPIVASQMGGVAPAPAAAAGPGATMVTATGTAATTLTTNIKTSLETFGNAIAALNNNVGTSLAGAEAHMAATKLDAANAIKLQKISEQVYKAFLGDSSAVAGTPAATGVYGNVLINSGTGGVTPTYVKETVAATPVADLAGAYAAAVSEFKASNPSVTTLPASLASPAAWATSEGITTS